MVTHILIESELDDAKRQRLSDELQGPLRTMSPAVRDEPAPPSWWHGDEDAYESSMMVANALGNRRR